MFQSLEFFVLGIFFNHLRALFELSKIVFIIAHSLLESCKQRFLGEVPSKCAVIGKEFVPCKGLLDLSSHLENFIK